MSMIPRYHILLGAAFTFLLWLLTPEISYYYLSLIFLSSVFIDLDHYIASLIKTKNPSLRHSLKYHDELIAKHKKDIKKGIRRKFDDFHLFHTIEFHILIGLLGVFWSGFFYIFIGMMFHSLLDTIDLARKKEIHTREFFFFNWARKKIKNKKEK